MLLPQLVNRIERRVASGAVLGWGGYARRKYYVADAARGRPTTRIRFADSAEWVPPRCCSPPHRHYYRPNHITTRRLAYFSSASTLDHPASTISTTLEDIVQLQDDDHAKRRRPILPSQSMNTTTRESPPPPSSSAASLPSRSSSSSSSWEEKIHHILAAPVGTLTSEHIDYMMHAIYSLGRARSNQDGSSYTPVASMQRAERLYRRLLTEVDDSVNNNNNQNPKRIPLTSIPPKVYNALLQGLANMNPKLSNSCYTTDNAAFRKAYNLWYEMLARHEQHPDQNPAPTDYHCSTVLLVCANHAVLRDADHDNRSRSDAAVALAEQFLRELEQRASNNNNSSIVPTANWYHHILHAHAQRSAVVYGAAAAAEQWLLHVSHRAATHPQNPLLETAAFNRVLRAWCDTPDVTGATRAYEILQLMMDLSPATPVTEQHCNSANVRPDPVSFGTVIQAYGRRNQPEKCLEILQLAKEYFATPPPPPSSVRVPQTEGDLTPIRNAARSTSQQQQQKRVVDLTQCYAATCFAWANSTDPRAAHQIEALLNESTHRGGGRPPAYIVHKNRAMYAALLQAHLNNNNNTNGVERADASLHQWVEECRHQKDTFRRAQAFPTTSEFESVLNGWFRYHEKHEQQQQQQQRTPGKQRRRQPQPPQSSSLAAERATELVRLMVDLSDHLGVACAPRTDTLEMCILLWTNTCRTLLRQAAELQPPRLHSTTNTTKTTISTDETGSTNSTTIDDPSTQQQDLKDQAISAALKSMELLDLAEARRLTRYRSYKYVIHRLCDLEHPDCAHEAVTILRRLEREADQGRISDWPTDAAGVYTSVLAALGRTVESPAAPQLAMDLLLSAPRTGHRPVHFSIKAYSAVLSGWMRLRDPRTARAAYDLFQQVKALDEAHANATTASSTVNHSEHSRRGDGGEVVQMDAIFLERVLWALTHGLDKTSAGRSCEVLHYMLKLHFAGRKDTAPTTRCFDYCLETLIQCQHERSYLVAACDLLQSIVQQYDKGKLLHLPSGAVFGKVMRACRQDGSAELVQRAQVLSRDAHRLGLARQSSSPTKPNDVAM